MANLYRQVVLCLALSLGLAQLAHAHGGVAYEEDLCVINIGFLKAHFTIYQPEQHGSEEFCEEIPSIGETVFVMEYQHDFLKQMPVDFRIIRDTQDIGIYARWDDVQAIADIDAVTAFYQAPVIRPDGAFTVNYAFDEAATYIGIVTAQHPDDDRLYNAVFYFQVGGPDYGTLPWFVVLALCLQGGYWVSNGGLKRWQERKKDRPNTPITKL
jgi:hypothetical protein